MKAIALLLLGSLVLVIGTTWWALEADGVGIITTRAADGTLRATHVWFAENEGELWLEAGTPENPWFLDALRDPQVSFSALEYSGAYVAEPIESPHARDRIRMLLRSKYGMRDRWVGLFVDSSGSVAVRLVPDRATGD
jgi:hypothetical protein